MEISPEHKYYTKATPLHQIMKKLLFSSPGESSKQG